MRDESGWRLVTAEGQRVGSLSFDGTLGFADGVAAVRMGSIWAFITERGNFLTAERFDEVTNFTAAGLALVRQGPTWFYLARNGAPVTGQRYLEAALPLTDGSASVALLDGRRCRIDVRSGKVLWWMPAMPE